MNASASTTRQPVSWAGAAPPSRQSECFCPLYKVLGIDTRSLARR